MTKNNTEQVLTVLRNVEGFGGVTPETATVERLGGLTNLVYRVESGGRSVIVRIPGEGTESYIDRAVEIHNTRIAAAAGVSAEVLWADPDTGNMVCDCIEGIVTMTPDLFQSRVGSPARAGAALRQLHDARSLSSFASSCFR
ncbi:MAG: choline/ethanolamine kinase family protein [Roseovarius pacificus]|nr:choline/ethanolamine kinase family protein [Roseovarius pacificus]